MAGVPSFRYRAGAASTEVAAGEGALAVLRTRLPRIAGGRWVAVSSAPVWERHGARLAAAARGTALDPEPLVVPDGERAKSWKVLGGLLEALVARGLRRDGGVVAFGGGTVGDVAGLAAALFMRGVPVVQAPTTLLAAVDSSLGGKTAVDLPAGKNLAGVVHQPALVVADTSLLATLPERAFRSGLAEVVKSALLSKPFWGWLSREGDGLDAREPRVVAEAVRRSLRLKAAIVAQDPDETTGRRVVLNLGHTIGHALETASAGRLEHGEAVAWGLLAILRLSVRQAGLAERDAERAAAAIRGLVRPPRIPAGARAAWSERLAVDKKADARGLRAVLLREPGAARVARVSPEALARALEEAIGR